MLRALAIASIFLSCAKSSGTAPAGDASGGGDGGAADAAGAGASCPPGALATNVDRAGNVTCDTADAATATAIQSRCQVYLGHRDSCDGCTTAPAKWGEASSADCSVGVGAGNVCIAPTLDAPVRLFGLDIDGDVDGNDKLYSTLHCIAAPRAPAPAPCAPGWFVTGKRGDTWECAPASEAAIAWVRSSCAIYTGWQDGCDGCTTPPVKWGYANDAGCTNGAGTDDTCTTAELGGETVHLFGLNPDGDVDGNDKFHVALHCKAPAPGGGSALLPATEPVCPDGQFVTGVNADGTPVCGDPSATFAAYVGGHCALYLGWHDSCDGAGCVDPPTKWGFTKGDTCTNGAGADDTCTQFALGGEQVTMFGLSTDGNVNADDKFYVGLRCD